MSPRRREEEADAEREVEHYESGRGSWIEAHDRQMEVASMSEIERCLIVDVETTGFDDPTEHVIELGIVLYSVKQQSTLLEFSTLLPGIMNRAEKINRIKSEALMEMAELVKADGSLQMAAAAIIAGALRAAQVVVSYNQEFDSRFFDATHYIDTPKPWRCLMSDFKWPQANREQGSLIHLALDHGIGVANAHRALADCRLIAALLDRMTDLPAMFRHAMRPKALFVSLAPFDEKDIVKRHGFKFKQDGHTKEWTRTMAVQDAMNLPFKVKQVGAIIP